MSKKIMSESQVKEVLNIDSFRNLSKDKIMEFVSLIPNMDVDVAMSIIDQFPNFTEMAEHIAEQLGVTCDIAITENSSSQRDVYIAYRKILDDLGEILKRENITPEERDSISNKMIEIADKMATKDSENKNYLAWIVKNKTQVVGGVLLLGVAILGANIKGIDISKLLK
jgi:hypothetical protein